MQTMRPAFITEQLSGSSRDLGIDCFVAPKGPTVHAAIKQFYHDFIVREIDDIGDPIVLHSMNDLPSSELQGYLRYLSSEEPATKSTETSAEKSALFTDEQKCLLSTLCHLPAARYDELLAFLQAQQHRSSFKFELASDTKEGRTRVHAIFNSLGMYNLESKTSLSGAGSSIDLKFHKAQRPKTPKPFLSFTLLKCGMDTMHAIARLASCMPAWCSAGLSTFSFGGTKDRRGVTTQRVCARTVWPRALLEAANTLNDRLMERSATASKEVMRKRPLSVGDFEWSLKPLTLGCHAGNEFEVVVRNISLSDVSVLAKNVVQLSTAGFINYFGAQRFGTCKISTHHIGAALLGRKYLVAFCMLLRSEIESKRVLHDQCVALVQEAYHTAITLCSGEQPAREPVQKVIDTIAQLSGVIDGIRSDKERNEAVNDYTHRKTTTIASLSHHFCVLHRRALADGQDIFALELTKSTPPYEYLFIRAFDKALSRNMKLLYIHAFQSFVFNKLASRYHTRITEQIASGERCSDNGLLAPGDIVLQNGKAVVLTPSDFTVSPTGFVRSLSIFNIVLPIIGIRNIDIIAQNESIYQPVQELLREHWILRDNEQMTPKTFKIYSGAEELRDLSSYGDWRCLYGRPGDLQACWAVREASDAKVGVSDMDVITGLAKPHGFVPVGADPASLQVPPLSDKAFLSLVLKFRLQNSMYATELLRELLRQEATGCTPEGESEDEDQDADESENDAVAKA